MPDDHGALYRFHREINRPFSTVSLLVSRAMELMLRPLAVDRLSYFSLRAEDALLTLEDCVQGAGRGPLAQSPRATGSRGQGAGRGPLAQSPRATGSRGQGAGRGPLAQSAV
ncbi:MAG: hypothetical protein HY551_07700, partial [Elusimicrobia bacterium]|nr:hypothetical protein [Elusimicrobiota bacterium]